MIDTTGAEIREPPKPSEVFLELWQWRALDQSPEKFAECADAWRQIVSLEELYAAAQAKDLANRVAMEQARLVPAPKEITYDCASAPMPENAPAPEPESKYTGYMSRIKNEARERLLRMRKENGVTVNDILAADDSLRWSDVMDMIEAKPVNVNKWEAVARILDKFEEAQTGGGKDS